LKISRQLLDEIVAHARADAPNECCGMIAARDGRAVAVHRARNAAKSPKLAYHMDGQEQYRIEMAIEDAGLELGAIYHSHPRSEPVPSQTDINLALHPHALYVIVGLAGEEPDVRAFRIVDGAVTPAALEIEDRERVDA
jgi:proteasome lid subunit RPN8/RPN11